MNLPVRTISSTCCPSSVSYSSSDLAISSSLSRLVVRMSLARLVGVVDDALDLAVDFLRGEFAVNLGARHLAAEEHDIRHRRRIAPCPAGRSCPIGVTIARAMLRRLLNVAGRAAGDIARNNFLGDAAGHRHRDHVQHFLAAAVEHVRLGQRHRRAERLAARNDGDLVQRMRVLRAAR